jgi:hypothetical protein
MSFVRIALIAPPRLPVPSPSYGGVEAVVDRLARGFGAAGHDGLLYTTGDSKVDLVEAVHKIPEIARDARRKACGGRLLYGADGE